MIYRTTILLEHLSSVASVTNRNKGIVTNDEQIIVNTENVFRMVEHLTLSMHTQIIAHINEYIKYFFWGTKHIAKNQIKHFSGNVSGSYKLEIVTLQLQLPWSY